MSANSTVGRYRLLGRLAAGGMAEIYLARQEGPAGFAKTVVVKRLLAHLSESEDFVEMFLDEARLAALLSHPNVVQVFDFGELDGAYYLIMEYLAGEDLGTIRRLAVRKGEVVPADIASRVVAQACEGLHYAHTLSDDEEQPLNIVHRDVSPANIMVTYQGMVKLLDFGIAKMEGKIQQTRVGVLKGKYRYMSPEQIRCLDLDPRSDVFSLGAVLHELLTGEKLFEGPNAHAVMRSVLEKPVSPPSSRQEGVPRDLDAVVMRALARDRNERYQSAHELKSDLEAWLSARDDAVTSEGIKKFVLELAGPGRVEAREKLRKHSGLGSVASESTSRERSETVPGLRSKMTGANQGDDRVEHDQQGTNTITEPSTAPERGLPEDTSRWSKVEIDRTETSSSISVADEIEASLVSDLEMAGVLGIDDGDLEPSRGNEIDEGDRLGRFFLEELIVRNPRTRVFLASLEGSPLESSWCVIRCVAPEAAGTDFADAFMIDARVAATLSHPNIVEVFDVGLMDGVSYYAMERLRGVDLLTIFGEAKRSAKPVPLDVVLFAAHQACEGLRHVHELRGRDGNPMGLVHRNVALSNLMITDGGVTKLLDFGVSGAEDSTSVPGFGHGSGRVDYISPEQARGERVDGRSDVFSLGVVMHELVTGHRLFHKDGRKVRPSPNAPAPIRQPSSIRRDLSPQIESIIMRALSHDPGKRFSSAVQLQEAIGSQMLGKPEQGRERLAEFVAERFTDRLADFDGVRPSSPAAGASASKTAARDAGGGSEPEPPKDASSIRSDNKEASAEAKKNEGEPRRLGLGGVLGKIATLVTVVCLVGAGIWIYRQERDRAPAWPLEAWRQSEAGKMAVPRPIGEPSSDPAEKTSTKQVSSRGASRTETKKAGELAIQGGELVVVCPRSCTVFVDGAEKSPDPSTGSVGLPAGQIDLMVVDDTTGRRHERRVMIAPGRVHVEEVDFPPAFQDRTGMEEW